ncbi:serine phosphatase RsbU (regulator of sigma subunit) [Curtobacterium sp. PhB130]|uniref:GAF domain-containing protein n=1 Tax=unclassified Curtobacterium TaxID=257496 RepID=UPI000F4C093A|nr:MULTISPECIES: GAF domain-containing protein [unclassified Curtobacterium]ROS77682.1 serine phosphatase RsbU (regulator of sigma subunit) [Curtobacterium sp. PhB130]TCK66110.1 serine phosphatase RsbU (regulator of sigma subunit) [Curtobacterium sp. PhB136]
MSSTAETSARRTAVVEALGILGSGPEERFDRITRMTQQAFGVPISFLNLVHDDVATAQSAQGWQQGGSAPASQVFCSTTVLQDEPLVVPDATLDPRFSSLAAVTGEPGIRFYAGAPLTMADGTAVGTLCIMDARPRELTAEDVELLRDLARWAERELGHAMDRDRVRKVLDGLTPEPVDVEGHDLDVVSSARQDSGDVLDWRVAADGTLRLTIGTISAAGRAAALLASTMRAAVVARTDVPLGSDGPSLEAQIAADLTAADAVGSLFHARVDPATGIVTWVDAGHGMALHVRADGTAAVLRSHDLPIGLQPTGTSRTHGTLTLAPGDRLVLFTAGTLALEGLPDVDAVATMAADDGAAGAGSFADRVRALLPTAPDADVTVVVLRRHPESTHR